MNLLDGTQYLKKPSKLVIYLILLYTLSQPVISIKINGTPHWKKYIIILINVTEIMCLNARKMFIRYKVPLTQDV